MTSDEFNEKWKAYLREGCPGLDFDDVRVIEFLNQEFATEVLLNPLFTFSQIKIKVGTARVYCNSSKKTEWEQAIDRMLMEQLNIPGTVL